MLGQEKEKIISDLIFEYAHVANSDEVSFIGKYGNLNFESHHKEAIQAKAGALDSIHEKVMNHFSSALNPMLPECLPDGFTGKIMDLADKAMNVFNSAEKKQPTTTDGE